MTRVKKGVNALKTRRNILRQVKGFRFARSKKERAAYEALMHAGTYSFAHRKDRKNDIRRLWQTRLSAALREHNISYSKFIGALKKAHIHLDRKVMAQIASESPTAFKAIVEKIS